MDRHQTRWKRESQNETRTETDIKLVDRELQRQS